MSGQYLCVLPASLLLAKVPKLDLAVTAARHESSRSTALVSARADDLSWRNSRRPGYAVDAAAASLESLVCPGIVLEFEDRDVTVRGGACEEAARLMRCPGDEVYRCCVESDFINLLPGGRLFAPDEDLAVIGG